MNFFDVAFLFDGSSFITPEEFRRTQLVAKAVLASYNISQDQTNVAAAVYARNVVIGFNFTEHYSLAAVSTAIDGISPLNQSSLNMSAALETLNNTLFATDREDAKDVLVVFASENLSEDITGIAKDLQDKGVFIIPVGVGNNVNVGQLHTIATYPSAVLTTSFQHIDTMEGIIGGAIAEGKKLSVLYINCRYFNHHRGRVCFRG